MARSRQSWPPRLVALVLPARAGRILGIGAPPPLLFVDPQQSVFVNFCRDFDVLLITRPFFFTYLDGGRFGPPPRIFSVVPRDRASRWRARKIAAAFCGACSRGVFRSSAPSWSVALLTVLAPFRSTAPPPLIFFSIFRPDFSPGAEWPRSFSDIEIDLLEEVGFSRARVCSPPACTRTLSALFFFFNRPPSSPPLGTRSFFFLVP